MIPPSVSWREALQRPYKNAHEPGLAHLRAPLLYSCCMALVMYPVTVCAVTEVFWKTMLK